MQLLRIRVERIVGFGTHGSPLGAEAPQAVSVQIDHRPLKAFCQVWREAGFSQPVESDAERLTLRLDMVRDAEMAP